MKAGQAAFNRGQVANRLHIQLKGEDDGGDDTNTKERGGDGLSHFRRSPNEKHRQRDKA